MRQLLLRCVARFVSLAALVCVGHGSSTHPSTRHKEASRALLTTRNRQAEIRHVLMAERNRSLTLAATSLHALRKDLRLGLIGLPVPADVQAAAVAAANSLPISTASVDSATEVLNGLLMDARAELDFKIQECQRTTAKERKEALVTQSNLRGLAGEMGHERQSVVSATNEEPEDEEYFQRLRADLRERRFRCQQDAANSQAKANSLRKDASLMQSMAYQIALHCASTSFLQTSSKPCLATAENGGGAGHLNMRNIRRLLPPTLGARGNRRRMDKVLFQLRGYANRTEAKGHRAGHRKRHHGRHIRSASFMGGLRGSSEGPCQVLPSTCTRMKVLMNGMKGEIDDNQDKQRQEAADRRKECEEMVAFDETEMKHTSLHKRDSSEKLATATGNLGVLSKKQELWGEMRKRDEQDLKDTMSRCESNIHTLLHGTICGLQRLRDQLWLLDGRTSLPEDCEVSEWSDHACSKSCGEGVQISTRVVVLEPDQGVECPPLEMQRPCGEARCPSDCVVSLWSGWSACSAACDGGIQERTRAVLTEARYGGDECPELSSTRICNSNPCHQDCQLSKWSEWSPCSKACGGGERERRRSVVQEAIGSAGCFDSEDPERREAEVCNDGVCSSAGDNATVENAEILCSGTPMDIVMVLDVSGDADLQGFGALREVAKQTVHKFQPSSDFTQIGIVEFAGASTVVSQLSDDETALFGHLDGAGFVHRVEESPKLAPALMLAQSVLWHGGRRGVYPLVLVLSHGWITDPFVARQAAGRLQARVVVVQIGPDHRGGHILKNLASKPATENLIEVSSLPTIASQAEENEASNRIILGTCSSVAPP